MGPDRTAFLRQARHIEHGDAHPVQMGRHPQHLANGDDAGAANACDHDAIGFGQAGRRGRRQGRHRFQRGFLVFVRTTSPPSMVTKLGQRPSMHEKSLLQLD